MSAPALGWTPRDGDTVHLHPRNAWAMPAGRYRLTRGRTYWRASGVTVAGFWLRTEAELTEAEAAAILTPISAAELERERQLVQLRAVAPLRPVRHRQHDASDLALFRAANEPGLGL